MSSTFRRVLVTGGSGFVGSHLVRAILARDPESKVVIVDNFVTGKKANVEELLGDDSRVELIEHDLNDQMWLADFLNAAEGDQRFSLILHFASPASPPRYQAMPIETYWVNSVVTHYLAHYTARQSGRMVFASTSEIYGDPLEHPQTEEYWGNVNPNGIRSCYDESKRFGETICGVHAREWDADIRLVRIFNTYGPRMDLFDGRVIPSFCLSALRNEPLAVFGDGKQTRSFCFVSDLVEGILRLAERDGLKGETVNIGNPNEFTLHELATELEQVVGHPLEKELHPLPGDDPKRRRPDISKARRLLDWEPKVPLSEGLRETFAYFRDNAKL